MSIFIEFEFYGQTPVSDPPSYRAEVERVPRRGEVIATKHGQASVLLVEQDADGITAHCKLEDAAEAWPEYTEPFDEARPYLEDQ